jgi:two-component system response regulator YesN
MSPTYFSHFFKEKTGHNFKEHVDSLRLEISKEMLNDGILKISKIASEVGYINTYSFSRFFKRKMGITPIDYREMIRRQLKQKN